MSTKFDDQLERARHDLLDLTARNRLLNTPLARGKSTRLDIVDELTSEVFRILVQEHREMSFLPTAESATGESSQVSRTAKRLFNSDDSEEEPDFPQPVEAAVPTPDRQMDRNLQTSLDAEKLQTRLLRLFYDAKAMFEEQGVNSLFLAMGFLEWYESPTSDKTRYAPLLLIPVELDRRTVNARFRVHVLEEEVTTNLSLQAKLKVDFGLQFPDVPDLEDLVPAEYFAAVERVIEKQPRWKVRRDRMTLWFFSFAKFLMFRDLAQEVWPEGKGPSDHPLVRGLLGEPVNYEPPLIGEDEPLDQRLDPQTVCHVVDCDSSQAAAIEEVRGGRNLVIQGPPGTGKSQSIANVIASAVRDGRTVLFVAEKLAALQVVKARLDRVGLGDICLELHSHKANRRSVLDDLDRTLNLGRPANRNVAQVAAELARVRARLNRYAEQLHQPLEPSARTPYDLIGTLCRLQADGISAFDCALPDLATWSATTLREKQALLRDIVEHVSEIGVPSEHAWSSARRMTPLFPNDLQSLQRQLDRLLENVGRILAHAADLAGHLSISWKPDAESFESVQRLAQFAGKLRSIPEMDRAAFGNGVWEQQRADIPRVIARGRELAECRSVVDALMAPAAWQMDVAQVRVDLAATGRSWWRWFSGRWRTAIGTLRGMLQTQLPPQLSEQLAVLDRLIAGQACLKDLETDGRMGSVGRNAFGTLWQGPDSDWDHLSAIVDWEADCRDSGVPVVFRQVIAKWTNTAETHASYAALRDVFKQSWEGLRSVLKDLEIDAQQCFGGRKLVDVPLAEIHQKLAGWREAAPELGHWIVLQRRLRELREVGLGPLESQIVDGDLDDRCLDRLELMYCEAAMRQVLETRDAIAGFDGISQSRLVDEFRKLDQQRIELARNEVAAAHYDRLPAGGDAGEVGIIRGEIRKKRKHRALRRLLADAGHAVQAIKPVFMMSPTSVAQFLEPGILSFDLIVMDEASQVRPVEALGAILRCRQAVVVGDNRQLPPTAFFDRVVAGDDDEDAEQEGIEAADVESILDLCVTRNFPPRMLRWHYRSRHHSLIAVSNREFYGNGLFVVPSPDRGGSGNGLEFRFVADGIFDRGRTRTNRREAQAVAQAMIEHARQFPDMSLGVGAFSVAQRDAILDELELLRRAHPETEEWFSRTADEPWFVKNLENIQGDERDTILISVGYGRDESGFFAMAFGPLSAKGGERRLNVLITRAKQRCVVFSSIRSEDIDLRRTNSRGTEALKTFLQYAETGRIDVSRPTDRDCDSEFEAQVADALRNNGWKLDYQVGIAGFFIDLAVIDPAAPGRYLLGIECDGATYHSARWARDRDRLRQAVLEEHGWKIHRIWSTDWFHSRDEQLRKLLMLLEDLRLQSRGGRVGGKDQRRGVGATMEQTPGNGATDSDIGGGAEIPREHIDPDAQDEQLAVPYEEVTFRSPLMSREIHELTATELASIVVRVVHTEGPIHRDEIARRVTTLWGLQRTGARIAKTVNVALKAACRGGQIEESAGFYVRCGQRESPIRSRENVTSASLRKPEMLPPQEIDAAILKFVEAHISASEDETARGVARLLGFKTTSQPLRTRLNSRIRVLVSGGQLSCERDVLRRRPE